MSAPLALRAGIHTPRASGRAPGAKRNYKRRDRGKNASNRLNHQAGPN